MKKVAFLIAAHNEEKIISKTLSHLASLPLKNYEIIVGLDGCTDKTEEIVKSLSKRYKQISYTLLNLRAGKPAVINALVKKTDAEIIIINDADWLFINGSAKNLEEMMKLFDNHSIGGVAESFPVEWSDLRMKKSNWVFRMVAYSSYWWLAYQKRFYTQKKGSVRVVKEPCMFLTNILRRKLYLQNSSLGDDFERTYDIMQKGYSVVLFENVEKPRMEVTYHYISLRDFMKQKIRTGIARRQLEENKKMKVPRYYYFSSTGYMIANSWRSGLESGFLVMAWVALTYLGSLLSFFHRKKDTKKGWELRIQR